MVAERHRAKRGLAITAGITAIAAGAALNMTHLVEGGQTARNDCLRSSTSSCRVAISHSRAVLSPEAVPMRVPSGEMAQLSAAVGIAQP